MDVVFLVISHIIVSNYMSHMYPYVAKPGSNAIFFEDAALHHDSFVPGTVFFRASNGKTGNDEH